MKRDLRFLPYQRGSFVMEKNYKVMKNLIEFLIVLDTKYFSLKKKFLMNFLSRFKRSCYKVKKKTTSKSTFESISSVNFPYLVIPLRHCNPQNSFHSLWHLFYTSQ